MAQNTVSAEFRLLRKNPVHSFLPALLRRFLPPGGHRLLLPVLFPFLFSIVPEASLSGFLPVVSESVLLVVLADS